MQTGENQTSPLANMRISNAYIIWISLKRQSIVDYRKLGKMFFYYIFKSDKMNWGKNNIFFSFYKWERIFVHEDTWFCK